MTPSLQSAGTVRNQLLGSMPPQSFNCLRSRLRRALIKKREILQEANHSIQTAYFIERGTVSIFARTQCDGPVEVGIVGRFGFIGIPIVLGTAISPHRCLVQMAGEALQIDANDLAAAMNENAGIRSHLLKYVHVLLVQHSQTVLCNVRHELVQRLSRWLLLADDRVDSDVLPLPHDLLSIALGVRRAGVTEALTKLQEAGAVQKDRGAIKILDRGILEKHTCECYRIISAEYQKITASGW